MVRAVFDFLPSVSEELPLFSGDVIEVLGVVDEFWLLGNKDGVTGQFPVTFVEEITIPSNKPGDSLYVCISDFSSAEPGNLSLKQGDVVVKEAGGSVDLGDSWQRGRNAWGVRGLFPSSCVKELNLSYRSRLLSERSVQSELPPYALGQARALMNLHAQLNEELDFREGDLIIITGLPEPGWFEGELNGNRGIFPEGFVELLSPLCSPQVPSMDYQYMNDDSQFSHEDDLGEGTDEEVIQEAEDFVKDFEEQKDSVIEEEIEEEEEDEEGAVYGVALYEFRAMEPGELDFDVGAHIRILSTLEDGWLEGKLRGQSGIFPHRFVKIEGDKPKMQEETNDIQAEDEKENSYPSESHATRENEWRSYEDHTVWDLDYFEQQQTWQSQEQSATSQDNTRQTVGGSRSETQSTRPGRQPPQRPKSAPPPRPRLPPRPNLPAHSNKRNSTGNTNRYNHTNASTRPRQPKLSHSLTLPNSRSSWSKDARSHHRHSVESTTKNRKSSLGQTLVNLVDSERQVRPSRHASVNDADMIGKADTLPRSQQTGHSSNSKLLTSIALETLATSASDLEAKLSQQLFEFEKSLISSLTENNINDGDLNNQSQFLRHYSILDYSSESDIIRGTSNSPVSHLLQSNSASSSLERRKTLRPPPPRPRVQRPLVPAPYKPARPAPSPPPRIPRQNTAPERMNTFANTQIFYTPEEPAMDLPDQVDNQDYGDLALAQEEEIQKQLEAEKDLEMQIETESEGQREEEERYQLLLRLQEVENDMEAYAQTAEELRAMLEEEEDETAQMQALENLEFCNYTLETLALEQQQLQGEGQLCVVNLSCVCICVALITWRNETWKLTRFPLFYPQK